MIDYKIQAKKVALVTGAARRIGAAIVKKLHQSGFRIAIHCHHSLTEAEELATNLNRISPYSACVLQSDLRSVGSADAIEEYGVNLITKVIDWGNRLDVLVNNASLFLRTDCENFKFSDWQDLFIINVQAPFVLSLAAYPMLASNHGTIINITDIHAEKPLKHFTVYCQTKAALVMQTKSLAKEFAPKVRVNAIAPGAIIWPEQANALSYDLKQKIIANTPLQCHGAPTFIAQAVLALIENPFITGQILNVDGGRSIN